MVMNASHPAWGLGYFGKPQSWYVMTSSERRQQTHPISMVWYSRLVLP
jgi:hypothetical protein